MGIVREVNEDISGISNNRDVVMGYKQSMRMRIVSLSKF